MPNTWQFQFGRSRQCSSYLKVIEDRGTFTMSGCPAKQSLLKYDEYRTLTDKIPPGWAPSIESSIAQTEMACCGPCAFHAASVHVYYFLDPTAKAYCESKARRVGFVGDPSHSVVVPGFEEWKRQNSTQAVTSVVMNGQTL